MLSKFFVIRKNQGLRFALRKVILFFGWKIRHSFGNDIRQASSQNFSDSDVLLELTQSISFSLEDQNAVSVFRKNLTPILHIVENFDTGGLERFVLDLAWGHAMNGQRAVVGFTNNGGQMEEEAKARGIEVHKFDSFEVLRNFVQSQKVTTCFMHHSYTFFSPELFDLADIIEVIHNPYWWQVGNSDLVHHRSRMKSVVCVSKYVASFANEMLQVNQDSLMVIPNCASIDRLHSGVARDGKVFLNVANFAEQKNQLMLIKGFIEFCSELDNYDYQLWLVGRNIEAELSLHVVKLLAENPKVRVKIFHVSKHEEMDRVYSESSFFILPSTFEGFSLSSLEALSYGLPSAISECGGYMELSELVPNLVLIPGITPPNKFLQYNYINATCWNPSDEQVRTINSSLKALLNAGPIEVEIEKHFQHGLMVEQYESLVALK